MGFAYRHCVSYGYPCIPTYLVTSTPTVHIVSMTNSTWYVSVADVLQKAITSDISWWHHQMESFSALLAICAGIHRSPHKGQRRRALMFSLICARINGWVNNRAVGDLRCHRAIMTSLLCHVVFTANSVPGEQYRANWVFLAYHFLKM